MKTFIIMAIVLGLPFLLMPCGVTGQTDSYLVPQDSIYVAGYKAIYYRSTINDSIPQFEWGVFLCDTKILATVESNTKIDIYNFCNNPPCRIISCNLGDINNDGNGEVIFSIPDTGNNERVTTYIYSLNTEARQIGVFNGITRGHSGIRFKDLDGDQVPELIFKDLNYQSWHYRYSESPAPYLVWKWDGQQYRLSNFKLARGILKYLYDINPDSISIGGYLGHGWQNYLKNLADIQDTTKLDTCWNPQVESSFPVLLFNRMLTFYYTNGELAAESIFAMSCNNTPENKRLMIEIRKKLESDPFWKELQQSNW